MLWHEARQAEDEDVHSTSIDYVTNKLDTIDFEHILKIAI